MKKTQWQRKVKEIQKRVREGFEADKIFGPDPGEFIYNIQTKRMMKISEIDFTEAERAMITILEQASSDIWSAVDNQEKKKNLLAYLPVYVALFKWGGMKAPELLPSLRGFMKAFVSKTKKEPPTGPEMYQILSKELESKAEVSKLYGFTNRRIEQLVTQRKKGGAGFKKKGEFYETSDVVNYARNEPSKKFQYIADFYDQHIKSKSAPRKPKGKK